MLGKEIAGEIWADKPFLILFFLLPFLFLFFGDFLFLPSVLELVFFFVLCILWPPVAHDNALHKQKGHASYVEFVDFPCRVSIRVLHIV